MITVTASQTWPTHRLFPASTARRDMAQLVIDGGLELGDLVEINDTTYRVALGHVLFAVETGPHLRAVEGQWRAARLARVTEDEARAIEWLELHQAEIEAYVAEAT